jgi:hypothetical protein
MQPVRIDCADDDWMTLLKNKLQEKSEVDLANFHYTVNGKFCETLAFAHAMEFRLDAKNSAGFFRKRSAGN